MPDNPIRRQAEKIGTDAAKFPATPAPVPAFPDKPVAAPGPERKSWGAMKDVGMKLPGKP